MGFVLLIVNSLDFCDVVRVDTEFVGHRFPLPVEPTTGVLYLDADLGFE